MQTELIAGFSPSLHCFRRKSVNHGCPLFREKLIWFYLFLRNGIIFHKRQKLLILFRFFPVISGIAYKIYIFF